MVLDHWSLNKNTEVQQKSSNTISISFCDFLATPPPSRDLNLQHNLRFGAAVTPPSHLFIFRTWFIFESFRQNPGQVSHRLVCLASHMLLLSFLLRTLGFLHTSIITITISDDMWQPSVSCHQRWSLDILAEDVVGLWRICWYYPPAKWAVLQRGLAKFWFQTVRKLKHNLSFKWF